MMKLTDENYLLPEIEALSSFDVLDHGTTKPLAVWGVDKATGSRGQFIVKFKNSGRMTTTSSAFELLGAWIAMELDLPVVEPVIINISREFVETSMKGRDGYRAAFQSQGINFGSKYIPGYDNIPASGFRIPDSFLKIAKLIYVFDMFIANTDRGHQRPNVISDGSKLLIFDHELAFSFLHIFPFLRNPTPWFLNAADKDLYRNHFFYNALSDLNPDLTDEVDLLARIDTAFWRKAYETMPQDWKNDQIMEIEPYLTSIVINRSYFAESLNKTFSV